MKKNKLQVLVGPPGSGKTTYANYLLSVDSTYVRVNRDDYRKMLSDNYVVSDKLEILINELSDQALKALLPRYNVVLDNTHCKVRYIKELADKYAQIANIEVVLIEPELTLDQLHERNKDRIKSVPDDVIDRMFHGAKNVKSRYQEIYEYIQEKSKPLEENITVQDKALSKAIIVDIDGTVAHMKSRSPYEWLKVGEDEPDEHVLNIIKSLVGYHVIFLSGRDSVCRKQTSDWLDKHFAGNGFAKRDYLLFMRPQNDYRKDSVVKKELYEKYIKDKYYVEAVFDDRDQVVALWRNDIGLKTFQCNYGNF